MDVVQRCHDTGYKKERFSGMIFFIFCEELSCVYITPTDEIFKKS
jgi:hypothetical protein